ncbi:ATP-binding protein [Streptomyces luomodiensis]|uniref:ATP-binding protein n=1 Tax=Streptomyces luomodiensis TaxID=3026192 RepID=A0ABY9V2T5_9ACTN|nr:ATP-binding protein [Streptomyces sp. SCA4-21]WNE99182.1 ATP-binding protein [Streptomyces sp. SCA4-21]
MDTEGTFDSRSTRHNPPPPPPPQSPPSFPTAPPPMPPTTPPAPPGAAPVPGAPAPPSFVAWLRAPRPEAGPGVWTYEHKPKAPEEPDRIPSRGLISGALIALLCTWLLWSLITKGYLGPYWLWPLKLLNSEDWFNRNGDADTLKWIANGYETLWFLIIAAIFSRVGHWSEVWRRYIAPLFRRAWDEPAPGAGGAVGPEGDPVEWPHLRAAGAHSAADRLAAEARAGAMNDVDQARIEYAWQSVRAGRNSFASFTDTVLRHGAASYGHPSGARDLPVRTARHDLVAHQVRLGTAADDRRNPYQHRGVGIALDPEVLGTSLLAVGPPGSGKTGRMVRPVVESLCLQALAGQVAVVAVGAAGAGLGADEAFDVVVKIGRSDSVYDLDLYGGTTDPDEAAGILAEALIGDMAASLPGGDSRRAATALAQLLGPYRAAHGRFPSVPDLRELLDGSKTAINALREALDEAGERAQARELEARVRQSGAPGDVGALLADRIALLDRPAFAEFFTTDGDRRPFSLRALEHPLRVRIDLPERGHAEASRMLARLVLAQFTECAVGRADRSLFACLVLDDASHTITPEALRGIQRLRSAHAGAVLTLRTLDDVPEALRSALLGAVGCRMACAGVTTWDGARFAEVWGTEWVETRDVTDRQIIAEEPFTKVLHFIRKVVTGKAVTTQSVTVRTVERERWSASELAHAVPAGHAVLSVTSVRGESGPPVLVDLRG